MTHTSRLDRRIGRAFRFIRRLTRLIGACTLCLALSSPTASAQLSTLDADPVAVDAPSGTPQIANYDYDPSYAAHGYGIDRFSDSPANNYFGRKLVRLDNGDVIAAGLVPRIGSATPDQLGLVRYTAAGRRIAWSSVNAAWSRFGSQYIVYPNGASGQPTGAFIAVLGIQTHGDNLYVMVNEQSGDGAVHPIVMVFGESGVFRGWWTFVPGGSNQKPGTAFAIAGSKLIVLGQDPNPSDIPSRPQIWMSRYTINADGGLSADPDFGTAGIATYRAYRCQVAATAFPCETYAAAITAQPGLTIPVAPKFYVAASVKGSGHLAYGTVALRFNGNGSRDTTFGYDTSLGYDTAESDFHDGGDDADIAVAIRATYHIVVPVQIVDDIYVVSKVSRSIQAGIGVVRLDGTGAKVAGFGNGGNVLFGGCGDGAGNCQFSNVEDVPQSIALSGGRLAIAGWYQAFDGTVNRFTDPMFAVVNAGSGVVENIVNYPIAIGDAVFYDVVANGDGTFTMAGDARDVATGNNLAYLTARLQPHDFIFRNGND